MEPGTGEGTSAPEFQDLSDSEEYVIKEVISIPSEKKKYELTIYSVSYMKDENGKDIFVHYTGIAGADNKEFKSLEQGAEVTFDTEEGAKGIQACNVVQV